MNFNYVFFMWRKYRKFVIILIYVDYILIMGNSLRKINHMKDVLNKEFEITSLGIPEKFLGIEIHRNLENRTINLNQSK